MTQTPLSAAEAIAAFGAGTFTTATRITDTARAIAGALDALRPLAASGKLAGIDLRDGGVPTIPTTPAQATADAAVLGLIAGPHVLRQQIAAAGAAGTTLTAGFDAFTVSDSAANIVANLASIQALWRAGTLGAVAFTDAAAPVLSLTADVVAADIDALQSITTPFSIALSDAGTPTITLPPRATSVAAFIGVVGRITTPFTLAYGGAMSAATAANIIAGHASLALLPANLTIVDSADQIAATLDRLQLAAAAGRIAAIEMRDGGLNIVGLTPEQLTSGAEAAARLSANVQLSQLITAAGATGASLDPRFASFTIQDSLAGILANLAAVDALMHTGRVAALRLTDATPTLLLSAADLGAVAQVLSQASGATWPIALTDADIPTVTIAADLLADAVVRARVLANIAGSFRLEVTGAISAATAAALVAENNAVLASLSTVRIADFAAGIVANLANLKPLAGARKIVAIDLLDGGVPALGITLTTALNNGDVLGLISTPYSNAVTGGSGGRLSAVSFLGMLSNLEYSAVHGTIAKITLSNLTTPTMPVSATDVGLNLEAFTKLDNPAVPAKPYVIALTGGGTPTVALSSWQVSAAGVTVLTRIAGAYKLAITGTLSAAAASLLVASNVAASVTGTLAIVDTSGGVAANLPALQTLAAQGRVAGITLLDGHPALVLTPAQAAAAPAALAAITSPYRLTQNTTAAGAASAQTGIFAALTVTDSAANVQANLSTLQPLAVNGRLASITVAGGAAFALSLTADEVGTNADALLRISNSYSIGLIGAGTPTLTLQHWQVGSTIGTLLDRITSPYALAVNGPITAAGASALVAAGVSVTGHLAANGLTVRDSPAGFAGRMGDLGILIGAGAVAAIELGGGAQTLSLAATDSATGLAMLPLIATPTRLSQIIAVGDIATATLAPGFSSFTVADSAANVLAGLAQIQALAAIGRLGRLQFTDPAPNLVVSTSSITAALDTWAAQDARAYPITLAGDSPVLAIPGATLGSAIFRTNILQAITNPTWSLVATGRLTATAAAAIVAEDGAALGHLSGSVTVGATRQDILASLDELTALARRGHLGAIDMLDAAPLALSLTDAQATENAASLARISQSYRLTTPSFTTAVETLQSLGSVAFSDFGPSSAINIRDLPFAPAGISFTYSGNTLHILKNGTVLGAPSATPSAGVTFTARNFYLDADSTGGTMLRATAAPIAMTDIQTNTNMVVGGDFYAGAVGYLQRQFINPTGHPVSVAAGIPNVFLHGGGAVGGNALQVLSGQNVIDGGVGSNFLVGGTDPTGADTFFLDARGGGVSWGTVVNFHKGDAVTFWGWKDGVTSYDWFASGGAPGFTGATIHARLNGGSGAYDASITFAGVDLATAQGFAFLTGSTGGANTYAYIANL